MPECGVCGSTEFKPHDGFYYCTECQTQSQDLRQQEMSFRANTSYGLLRKPVAKPKKERVKQMKRADRLGEGPIWTTWQAFNFMLKGMTEEMIALGAPDDFEKIVLQLWACYLKVYEVAFTSQFQAVEPKLSFPFRYRDGKVLYDIDSYTKYTAKIEEKKLLKPPKVRKRIKNRKSKIKLSSRKMVLSDYESYASDINSHDDMNMTLESLPSSSNVGTPVKKLTIPRKRHMTEYAAKIQKRNRKFRYRCEYMTHRQTLLCIIHIALMMTHSQIQLSDLLRFIREGHLSYSVLSHFLPAELKFGRKDCIIINCENDRAMPTHWFQRSHLHFVMSKLKMHSLPSPDFVMLLKRYALDLMLPEELSDLAIRLLQLRGTPEELLRLRGWRKPLISFELIALAPLLVVMKLLFGLDGVTERNSSHFAETLNRLPESNIQFFSWCQWQRAIECRKTVLTVWHYPTREIVAPETVMDAKLGFRFLQNIHKDPHLRDRKFKWNGNTGYGPSMKVENKIEEVLEEIVTRDADPAPTFSPSLTPGITLLQDLISWLRNTGQPDPPWLKILAKDWSSLHVNYLLDPEPYSKILKEEDNVVSWYSSGWLKNHMSRARWVHDKLDRLNDNQQANRIPTTVVKHPTRVKQIQRPKPPQLFKRPKDGHFMLRSDCNYWRLLPSDENLTCEALWPLETFNTDVMPKFPSSWSWLLTLCSQMLHIYPRDIYTEVILLENDLIQMMGAT